MKKIFTKIGVFIIIGMIINIFPMMVSYAEEMGLNTLIKHLSSDIDNENKCYDETTEGKIYPIITVIEEPLLGKTSETSPSGEAPMISKICYRMTVQISGDEAGKKPEIQGGLVKECTDVTSVDGLKAQTFCKQVQVILSKGGTSMIEGYISIIYRFGATVAGLIAVIVIVISAVQISTSGGDATAIEEAKKRIMKSIGGIAVLFLSGIILYTINPNFFTAG